MRGARGRAGTSTIEVVVCLGLMALVVHLSWALLAEARSATARVLARSEALETERIGWHVLAREVGAGVAGRDWTAQGARVLPLRAFRAVGRVCGAPSGPGSAVVHASGMRLAEPEKDSLLLLTAEGAWVPARLAAREPSLEICATEPTASVELWRWEPAVERVVLARVFERGSYHLEDRAVRYRFGESGRQPLTEERLEPGSAFLAAGGSLQLRLLVRADTGVVWTTLRPLVGEESGGG